MFMMRDPRGPNSIMDLVTKWNPRDTNSWTDAYRSQVPWGIDPLDA